MRSSEQSHSASARPTEAVLANTKGPCHPSVDGSSEHSHSASAHPTGAVLTNTRGSRHALRNRSLEHSHSTLACQNIRQEKIVHNFSSFELSPHLLSILELGISFTPTPKCNTLDFHFQLLRAFDSMAELRLVTVRKPEQTRRGNIPEHPIIKNFKFLSPTSYSTPIDRVSNNLRLENFLENKKTRLDLTIPTITRMAKPNLTRIERSHLRTLQTPELVIQPADKNLGIVILSRQQYINASTKHLRDPSTYTIKQEPKNLESQLINIVISFKQVSKRLYDNLTTPPKFSTPPFYGLPKIHKKFEDYPPIRPIVAQHSSVFAKAALLIDAVLQPLVRRYQDHLLNSVQLVKTAESLCFKEQPILVTMDVESLYPSIPQEDLINTIYKEMYRHTALISISPNLIIKLLHLCINNTYFEFGNLVFQQHKGTAMGAAFSPSVANIFMSVFFRNVLITQDTPSNLLKRYIDDIFLIWMGTEQKLKQFIHEANLFHTDIKFTSEYSTKQANFLDVTVLTYRTADGWRLCCKT